MFEHCSKLEHLNLASNEFKSDGKSTNYFKELEKFSYNLKYVSLDDCKLNTDDGNKCSKLETVKLTGNGWPLNIFGDIYNYLEKSSDTLKELSFTCQNKNEANVHNIKNLLKNCKNLIKISFKSKLQEAFFKAITEGLKFSKNSLIYINLSNCQLNERDGSNLAKLLKECSKLEIIKLNNNHFGNEYINVISALFQKSSESLKEIYVFNVPPTTTSLLREKKRSHPKITIY